MRSTRCTVEGRKKLNRPENLRAIPRSDPDFARLYAGRGDAETVNRALEDTLYLNRTHSEGHLRQTADLLGFALMGDSLTLARASRTRGRQGRRVGDSAPAHPFFKHAGWCFASVGARSRRDRMLGRLDIPRMLARDGSFCHVSCIPPGT